MATKEESIEEKLKKDSAKTLSIKVVKRFMSDEEWAEFRKEYWQHNRRGAFGNKRGANWDLPLTDKEKTILKTWIEDIDISSIQIGEAENIPATSVRAIAITAAFKILAQNPRLLQNL